MRINNRRLILISGLALAINSSGTFTVDAAGVVKNKAVNKTVRVAQTPLDLNSTPVPNAAPQTPVFTPTPPGPTSTDPAALPPVPATDLSDSNAPVTTPTPQGSKPKASTPERPPLGFFYGEQDRLDVLKNPNVRRYPVPTTTYPSTVNPPAPLPLNSSGIQLTPVPDSGVETGVTDVVTSQPTNVDRFGFAPPPGTLGQTYKRRSRVIEDTKHPRVGAVEVNLPEEVDVTGLGLKTKWTGKVWRLESEPLLPGIPHIYEIKASWGEGTEPQVRTIRLIMGRIVDLDF